jgi:hypothetical protein
MTLLALRLAALMESGRDPKQARFPAPFSAKCGDGYLPSSDRAASIGRLAAVLLLHLRPKPVVEFVAGGSRAVCCGLVLSGGFCG